MKELLYDWVGYNKVIFLYINGLFSTGKFEAFLTILSRFEYPHFDYTLIGMAFTTIGFLLYKDHWKNKQLLVALADCYIVVAATIFFSSLIMFKLKRIFLYPRPFCLDGMAHQVYHIKALIKNLSCEHSFPSGHTTYAASLILPFWPIMNNYIRIFSVLFVSLVMAGRMGAGVHFPADTIWALLVTVIIAFIAAKLHKKFTKQYTDKILFSILKFFERWH